MQVTMQGSTDRVVLVPEDIPGAVLPQGKSIEDCSNLELRRWLECRGLKKLGNKLELVERVANCVNAGRGNIIFLGVDGGKWYDRKRNVAEADGSTSNFPSSAGISMKWGKFPSRCIPKYFNKGHIYTYIAGLHFENEEYTCGSEGGITEKPFRRGSQFVSSDHLSEVYDTNDNMYYYLKSKCLASFRANTAYNVKCTINQKSGAVVSGECECKQSALGKCSHVSALLLFLSKYAEKYGHDGEACTSKLQEWGLGAKFKTPGPVASKTYPTLRFKPLERAVFDPRPASYVRDVNLNDFISNLQNGASGTMFETLFKLKYDNFEVDKLAVEIIKQQIEIFVENMKEYMNGYETKIFAVKGAEVQGSEEWKKWRTYFITASNAKTASSLTTSSAKSNFLKRNLWQLTPTYSMLPALVYGHRYEASARKQYILNYVSASEKCIEVGLHVNKDYPHLACSVDGVITENGNIKRIIEIKCPKILENTHPSNFPKFLTDSQKGSFCLEENDGQIRLKPNHPYLYQIATSMLIFNSLECDFIVWSKIGMLVLKIKMENVEPIVIDNLCIKLKKLYYNMYVPEMFMMKIPRRLPLYEFADD